jgi:hypothetical protein
MSNIKTIYETEEAKLAEGEGAVLISLRAWGHSSSIQTKIWTEMVKAWLDTHPADKDLATHDRIKEFVKAAKALRFEMQNNDSDWFDVVPYQDVKRLLINLSTGKDPDHIPPPSWAGKDVVGYLLRRGWKVTDDGKGLHRRGYFIPANYIETSVDGGESLADRLESECAQRTDREDKR